MTWFGAWRAAQHDTEPPRSCLGHTLDANDVCTGCGFKAEHLGATIIVSLADVDGAADFDALLDARVAVARATIAHMIEGRRKRKAEARP